MEHKTSDWLTLGLIAFIAGIVSNIIIPDRRGVLGFLSAAVVGVFCGGVAGITASAYEIHPGAQYMISAAMGLFGYKALKWIMRISSVTETIVNISGGQNVIGDGNKTENRDEH